MALSRAKRAKQEESPTGPDTGAGGVSGAQITAFAALFQGYSKAHGQFIVGKAGDDGKVKGWPSTLTGGVTPQMFAGHLRGTGPGIGVVMLGDDDRCWFGAIDYDVRTMDHAKAEAAVKKLGLPLVLCRSKSGGGHFYVFLAEPVDAGLLRDRLDEWRALLGMAAKTEIFPKQSTRFNDNDIGNWINLPYFNAAHTVRYAVVDGQAASLAAFLALAEAQRVTPEQLERPAVNTATLFEEGPPCLQVLEAQGGFAEGSRNDGMMGVVVYLRKRFGDAWEKHLDDYNRVMANLPSSEIVQLIKSNGRREYGYACKKAPLNSVCQRRVCTQREFGVGDGPSDQKGYQIGGLTRYDSAHGDEPMWGMEINGKRVMVSNSQFYARDDFNRAAMAQANVLPIQMTPSRWLRYLAELISTADVVEVPEDAGPSGQLWSMVETFTTQRANAIEKEEVWLGKPYRESGKVYFRSQDLFRFLDNQKVRYPSAQAVWQLLRRKDADKVQWHIKDRVVNLWVLPLPDHWDSEHFAPPPKIDFDASDDF